MARKRNFNTFNLAFLDIMSCGFGAVVLFFMIINHATKDRTEQVNEDVISETSLLEKRVEIGKRNLVEARNTIEQVEQERVRAEGLARTLLEELTRRREELAELDADTLAQVESINKLKADLRSIEEERRRLEGAQNESEDFGDDLLSVLGTGDRLYLTGLNVGGKRAMFLVDSSASMLDRTIVNIIRRRNMSDEDKIASRKWQRVLGSVEWLVAKLPPDAQFQIYTFNQLAEPVLAGTEGTWLSTSDREQVAGAVAALNEVVPGRGTSLHRAYRAAAEMSPPPDNIFLITDGLPTMGDSLPGSNKVSGKRRRRLFAQAAPLLPRGVPVNVILLPMEGDPAAASAFWQLAQATNGSFLAPADDWP